MTDEDIQNVMKVFNVDKEKAIEFISKGINPKAIKHGFVVLEKEINRITEKYTHIFEQLKNKIALAASEFTEDFSEAQKKSQVDLPD